MYISQGSTLPVPFNMLPSSKSAVYAWNTIKQLLRARDGSQRLHDTPPASKTSFITVRPPPLSKASSFLESF